MRLQEPEDDAAVDEEEMEDLRAALEEDYELGCAGVDEEGAPQSVRMSVCRGRGSGYGVFGGCVLRVRGDGQVVIK